MNGDPMREAGSGLAMRCVMGCVGVRCAIESRFADRLIRVGARSKSHPSRKIAMTLRAGARAAQADGLVGGTASRTHRVRADC